MLPVITVKTLLTRSIFAKSEAAVRATSQVVGHPPSYNYQWGWKMSRRCVTWAPFIPQHTLLPCGPSACAQDSLKGGF